MAEGAQNQPTTRRKTHSGKVAAQERVPKNQALLTHPVDSRELQDNAMAIVYGVKVVSYN